MDLVGPLPRSKNGNRFILIICDYATRYPEAIPLPSTEGPRIVKELLKIFTRVGVPEEMLMDQGTNFMSGLLGEIYCVLRIADQEDLHNPQPPTNRWLDREIQWNLNP